MELYSICYLRYTETAIEDILTWQGQYIFATAFGCQLDSLRMCKIIEGSRGIKS